MSVMEGLEDFEVCMDITTRMALVALAMSVNTEMLPSVFEVIEEDLAKIYPDASRPLISTRIGNYKAAATAASKRLWKP